MAWQQRHPGGSAGSSQQAYLDTAKAGTWEGGHRTAAIVWAPGLVAPATTIREVVSSMDIFVTTLSLAGIELPADREYGTAIPGTNIVSRDVCFSELHSLRFRFCNIEIVRSLPPSRYDGRDITPLLRGDRDARSPHDWIFYYTTCTELNGCPTPTANQTAAAPSDRIAAVRQGNGPMKARVIGRFL